MAKKLSYVWSLPPQKKKEKKRKEKKRKEIPACIQAAELKTNKQQTKTPYVEVWPGTIGIQKQDIFLLQPCL